MPGMRISESKRRLKALSSPGKRKMDLAMSPRLVKVDSRITPLTPCSPPTETAAAPPQGAPENHQPGIPLGRPFAGGQIGGLGVQVKSPSRQACPRCGHNPGNPESDSSGPARAAGADSPGDGIYCPHCHEKNKSTALGSSAGIHQLCSFTPSGASIH